MEPKIDYIDYSTWVGYVKFDEHCFFESKILSFSRSILEFHHFPISSNINHCFRKNEFAFDSINMKNNEPDEVVAFSLSYPKRNNTEQAVLDEINIYLANVLVPFHKKNMTISTTSDISSHIDTHLLSDVKLSISHSDIKEILCGMRSIINPFFERDFTKECHLGVIAMLKHHAIKTSCLSISWIVKMGC